MKFYAYFLLLLITVVGCDEKQSTDLELFDLKGDVEKEVMYSGPAKQVSGVWSLVDTTSFSQKNFNQSGLFEQEDLEILKQQTKPSSSRIGSYGEMVVPTYSKDSIIQRYLGVMHLAGDTTIQTNYKSDGTIDSFDNTVRVSNGSWSLIYFKESDDTASGRNETIKIGERSEMSITCWFTTVNGSFYSEQCDTVYAEYFDFDENNNWRKMVLYNLKPNGTKGYFNDMAVRDITYYD
ncbi:hypothetical protein V6R21_19925 [Limibacter armeniacum]|uniref:hypothetical protein n=1 Tax=Limibacter armeniacum TaxID=466084 RepID=UPI002FE5EBED